MVAGLAPLPGQITLRPGQVETLPYRMMLPPPGTPCVVVPVGTPSSARLDVTLDSESLHGTGAFRFEILGPGVGASAVWAGSNSPLSITASGYFYSAFAVARFTGMTGTVVITRVTMPWVTSEYNPVIRQYQSCPQDGIPFVPNLHLTIFKEGPDQLRLRWTTNAAEYQVVTTDFLPAPAWIQLTNSRSIVGDYFETTLDTVAPKRFFRLYKP